MVNWNNKDSVYFQIQVVFLALGITGRAVITYALVFDPALLVYYATGMGSVAVITELFYLQSYNFWRQEHEIENHG